MKMNEQSNETKINNSLPTASQSNISVFQTESIHNYSYSLDVEDESGYYKSYNMSRLLQAFIDLGVCIAILAVFACVYFLVEPKLAYFTCDNSDIFYPYIKDTIPFWAVGLFGTAGPILFIIIVEFLNASLLPCQKKKLSSRWRTFGICVFHSISLFALGISITLLMTEIGKRWIGRLRPHFISVCQPNLSQLNCIGTSSVSGTYYNPIYTGGNFCTNTDISSIREARFSFPSGHSSYSNFTMVFLIIYLEARLYLLRFRYLKPLIQLAALIAAFVTCLSRISDYHHRGSDVIGGAILVIIYKGWLVAFFITSVVGKVLWQYEKIKRYSDFDFMPRSFKNIKDLRI